MNTEKYSGIDYESLIHRDRAQLVEFRKAIQVTQADLAAACELAPSRIASIENGDRPFTAEMSKKIWPVLFALADEFYEREFKRRMAQGGATGADIIGQTFNPWEFLPIQRALSETEASKRLVAEHEASITEGQQTIEALQEQVVLLKQEVGSWKHKADFFQSVAEKSVGQVVQPLFEQIEEMKKQLADVAAMQAEMADLRRLVGLKTEAVVKTDEADTLQSDLEHRAKRDED
jgi:transcriptional regulator with XRE-family HTH domain